MGQVKKMHGGARSARGRTEEEGTAPLRSAAARLLEVGGSSKGGKGVGCAVGEPSKGGGKAVGLVVGEASKGGKGVGYQRPLRSLATESLSVGVPSKAGKGARCQGTLWSSISSSEGEEVRIKKISGKRISSSEGEEVRVKKISGKRITWAGEVGGELLKVSSCFGKKEEVLATIGKDSRSKQREGFNAGHQRSKLRAAPEEDRSRDPGRGDDGSDKCSTPPAQPSPEDLIRRY